MKINTQLPMKKLMKPLGLLFCMAAIVSCSKKDQPLPVDVTPINPLSDFTITADPSDALTYMFTSLAKNDIKLAWRFGDDSLSTDSNPTHTYQTTGNYQVSLETTSKTGNTSNKYTNLLLDPNKILQATAVKTEVLYQLQFGITINAKIKSAAWTFNAVDPVTAVVKTTTSTSLTPLVSFAYGSFNNFSLTVTTDKGSVVTISKSVTTDGIATDVTQTNVGYSVTYDNTDNTNENAAKLIDNNTQTKFGYYSAFPGDENIQLTFPAPIAVKLYAIENGNDSESTRDPKEWYIEGSNDGGTTWSQVDHQLLTIGFADYLTSIGQYDTRYYRYFYYPIANPKAYSMYRWRIVSTFAGAFQIMEFKLFE
ncbi:PKD domain-containing protein [Mucilaginibacter corticis]|uniref:PKD domain-containing protein n=1 Tax=Mucilaginibacter corticis TaxID=2597670 RepID=A0A556MLC7_9SPHI|nr:PKD domain-containing protein [Mucilaginibacter corticis]TSJ40648.1 PKD domain-containing protein [Mucilaginibacter corticis]